MNRFCTVLLLMVSGAAIAQTTGTLDPRPTPTEPSATEDVPPGGCMPIGMTASGEMVFPIQCKEIIERERRKTVRQNPAVSDDNAPAKNETPRNDAPVFNPVETVPLPKSRERATRATSANGGYGCQGYRTYDPASRTYIDYEGRRRSCR
jgi:BA14K-like protein